MPEPWDWVLVRIERSVAIVLDRYLHQGVLRDAEIMHIFLDFHRETIIGKTIS